MIHVGMPKTGSTAIQHTLAANRDSLAAEGIHYPPSYSVGRAHHTLAWSASVNRVPRDGVPPLDIVLDALTDDLAGVTGTAILSSEALFHLPAREIAPIVRWARKLADSVLLISYVRPPAAYHEGWYRQLVKTSQYELNFAQHLQRAPRVRTLVRLEGLQTLDGATLHVLPYQLDLLSRGDVVADFCAHLGIESSTLRSVNTG